MFYEKFSKITKIKTSKQFLFERINPLNDLMSVMIVILICYGDVRDFVFLILIDNRFLILHHR